MFHRSRVWCVTPVASAEDLAEKLTTVTWTCCTAFELGDYLWLNRRHVAGRGPGIRRCKAGRSRWPPAAGREHHVLVV